LRLGTRCVPGTLAERRVPSNRGALLQQVRGRSVATLFLAWVALIAFDARAERAACVSGTSPWVRFTLDGSYFPESLRASVMKEIASDLERIGLVACEGMGAGKPVAEMRITLARPASVSIELRDEVSGEHYAREISLAAMPSDALGLSIAATAEELLHASWAQNALGHPARAPTVASAGSPVPHATAATSAPTPSPDAPRPRSAANTPSATEPPSRHPGAANAQDEPESWSPRADATAANVYLLGAGEMATQGQAAFGSDLGVTWGGRLTVGARAGFRVAPEIASTHGTIEMREGVLALTGAIALVPRKSSWGGELVIHGELLYVEFDGVASSGARAIGGSTIGAVVSGGLGGWAQIARSWSIVGEATGGAPIRAVAATDSGTEVTGVRGLLIGFGLGVATRL
jgi:hypothetical protein